MYFTTISGNYYKFQRRPIKIDGVAGRFMNGNTRNQKGGYENKHGETTTRDVLLWKQFVIEIRYEFVYKDIRQ